MQHADGCAADHRLEDAVQAALATYGLLAITPQPGKFTILASFVLHDQILDRLKVISLGTGSKCLPAARLPMCGDALHDSHAEAIARRGFTRWILEEIRRDQQGVRSDWLYAPEKSIYALKNDIYVYLYVSTVPCKKNFASCAFPSFTVTQVAMLQRDYSPLSRIPTWPRLKTRLHGQS